jgi:cell wall-associated NlpC family hydrolase
VNRSLRAVLAAAVAALLLAGVAGSPARADPTTPAQIEKEIRDVWLKAEPLIEEYNGVHEQYKKNRAKQADLQKKLEPLQRQLDLAQLRIGAIAAQVYKGGQADAFNAVLSSGSPDMLADRLSYLDAMAREQQRQLTGVTTLKAQYDAQKAPIDQLVATLAKQDADLAKKKKDIEAKITQLQKLRRQAYGTTGATGSVRPWPCPATYEPTNGYKVAAFACKQAGKPYVWAADGPDSYDCSGLTLAAWKQVGVYLPHQSRDQRASIPTVTGRSNLKLGDLIFYYSPIHHVAIYVGDGKVMHAPSFGDVVRMATIDDAGPIHSFGRPK